MIILFSVSIYGFPTIEISDEQEPLQCFQCTVKR